MPGPRADLDWHGDQVSDQVRDAGYAGLMDAAEHLLAASNAVVPLDEGTLERSGGASGDRQLLRSSVTYDTPYAVRQHEELDYRHAPGRTAKYLEEPAHELAPELRELVAASIWRAAAT